VSLAFIAAIMGVPWSTARRAMVRLGLTPRKVGATWVLSEAEAIALSEYLAAKQAAKGRQ
jgi:hypothetical protein